MDKTKNMKKIVTNFLAASAFVSFAFSILFITIAYNVSSMKAALNGTIENNAAPDIEKLRALYPDYFTLASLEIKFPAGKIPIIDGSTFEAYLNRMYQGKNINDWSYRYTVISAMGEFNKITDEAYLSAFYNLNASFIKEIVSSYEKPFFENSAETKIYTNLSAGKLYEQNWLAGIINNMMILKIAYRSLDKKDYDMALKSDIAYLRFTSAAGVMGDPCLASILNYDIYSENKFAANIYIKENAYLADGVMKNKFRNALKKRVEFIKIQPDFAVAVKNTAAMLKTITSGWSLKDRATYHALNLWYGDPNAPFMETSDLIYSKKGSGYSEYEKILYEVRLKYPSKRSFTKELAYTGDDIFSLLGFIKFAINTHPLEPNSHIPIYEFNHYVNIHTKFRLTTLGGLARLFYAENKRWPDLEKDGDFLKEAGIAAIDGYSNKKFRAAECKEDGSMILESALKDWYDPYKKTSENVKLKVPKPF